MRVQNQDLKSWLSDVSSILSLREFISKQDAEDEVHINADAFTEQHKLGYSPMQAYLEYMDKE